jgi:ABC-type spermidine/putrescine transport system permease subunit II
LAFSARLRVIVYNTDMVQPGEITSLLVTGWVLVFVNAMKELPATLLLHPIGFDTLEARIWIETSEEFYAQAAPAALLLSNQTEVLHHLLCSTVLWQAI